MDIPDFSPLREPYCVGCFSAEVAQILKNGIIPGDEIYISPSNIEHIRNKHPDAYLKYFDCIEDILASPDYVGIAGVQLSSYEFIKKFEIQDEYVNVAVRTTKRGRFFIRTLFILNDSKMADYIRKGTLTKLK